MGRKKSGLNLRDVAIHEAGHAVAAHRYGCFINEAVATSQRGVVSHTVAHNRDQELNIQLAGWAAESQNYLTRYHWTLAGLASLGINFGLHFLSALCSLPYPLPENAINLDIGQAKRFRGMVQRAGRDIEDAGRTLGLSDTGLLAQAVLRAATGELPRPSQLNMLRILLTTPMPIMTSSTIIYRRAPTEAEIADYKRGHRRIISAIIDQQQRAAQELFSSKDDLQNLRRLAAELRKRGRLNHADVTAVLRG